MSGQAPGGGSTDKLNDPKIAARLNQLWAEHQAKPADPMESVEMLKLKNRNIRLNKHIPPRDPMPVEKPKRKRKPKVEK